MTEKGGSKRSIQQTIKLVIQFARKIVHAAFIKKELGLKAFKKIIMVSLKRRKISDEINTLVAVTLR